LASSALISTGAFVGSGVGEGADVGEGVGAGLGVGFGLVWHAAMRRRKTPIAGRKNFFMITDLLFFLVSER
jgi:hypothetical protein